MPRALRALPLASVLALVSPLTAAADPVWVGDMEGGDLSQWNGQLNGQYITVVESPTIQGAYAAQVQLMNDAVWPNGLKRVELHHSPADGRTDEGAELYFAWSFYLPETLPTDPGQEIGYWESDSSYQQVMAFDVQGEQIQFSTRKPSNQVHWDAPGMVTAGVWHRIAMHVLWSTDESTGYVDVWFDGVQVVEHGAAQTLADGNSTFTQIGLLRGAVEFSDSPIIVLDDAVEGDTLADVHPDLPGAEGGGGAGAGGAPASGGNSAGGAPAGGGNGSQGGSEVVAGGGTGGGDGSGSEDGCSCQLGEAGARPGALFFWGLVLSGLAARRRGACTQTAVARASGRSMLLTVGGCSSVGCTSRLRSSRQRKTKGTPRT